MTKSTNIYSIPLFKKDINKILSDHNVHQYPLNHAIDFLVPQNTPILAAQDGEVVDVKVDSNEGGFEEKYIGNTYLNFISILHENDEISQYCHLKYNGSNVKVGDKVKKGDIIGYSGNTGFSSEPHLHFHICKIVKKSKFGWETIEIQFNEQIKILKGFSKIYKEDKETIDSAFE